MAEIIWKHGAENDLLQIFADYRQRKMPSSKQRLICRAARVIAIPSSLAVSIQRSIAASAWPMASLFVRPCAMQPGNSGTSTTNIWSDSSQKIINSYRDSFIVPLAISLEPGELGML